MTAIPETMRALVLKEDGFAAKPAPNHLEALAPYVDTATVAVPELQEGEVLIRVRLAAVNPSDVMFIKGMYGRKRQKGMPAGFEGVGEVVASAGGYGDSLIGRRVSFVSGARGYGTWAEYSAAEAMRCIPLREDVSDEDAAGLIVNPLTAMAMFGLVREAGEKAFVLSAGASQLCKLMTSLAADEGFRPISLVRRASQVAQLKALGAAHVLDQSAEGYTGALKAVLREEKPVIFLDAVTGPSSADVFAAMGRSARWIVYGRLDSRDTVIPEPGQLIFQGKRIEGFWLTDWMRGAPLEIQMKTVAAVQERFARGRWKTDVTAIVLLSDAVEQLAEEAAKPDGKVLLKP